MKTTIKAKLIMAALAALPCLTLGGVEDQFSIDWFTIDGGGGTSSGGDFSVSGAIGQWDAASQSGGPYGINGGFWAGLGIIQTPSAPRLGVTRDLATGEVTIFWTLPDNGFELFRSPTLGQAPNSWMRVPPFLYQTDGATRFITIPSPTDGQNFFKLFPIPDLP